jgi:tripartite-type tricarboxylate transporter receptor subunit TctC
MSSPRVLVFVSLVVLALAGCSDSGAPSQSTPADNAAVGEIVAKNFGGQTVTILVGFNPGGGTDTSARLLNKYLSRHLPGNPNVIVQNMSGAAGIRALNYAYEGARPDGLTLLYAPISLLVPLLGEPGIRYELDKFEVIGGLRSGPIMQFARQDIEQGNLANPADIASSDALVLGGIRTSSSLDLMPRLAFDSLGLDYRYVTGYSSENTVRNAIQTNEINSFGGTFSGYRSAVISTLIEPGIVAPLWHFPYRDAEGNYPRASLAPDIPTFMEVYEEISGEPPSGEHWEALKLALDLRSVADNMLLAPPNSDPAALMALREAFDKAVADEEMIDEVTRVLGYFYEVVPRGYISQRFAETAEVDRASVEFIQQYIVEE